MLTLIKGIKCKVTEIMLIHEISMKKLGNEGIQVDRSNKKIIEMATIEMSTRIHITSLNKTHITSRNNTKTHITSQTNIKAVTSSQPHTKT